MEWLGWPNWISLALVGIIAGLLAISVIDEDGGKSVHSVIRILPMHKVFLGSQKDLVWPHFSMKHVRKLRNNIHVSNSDVGEQNVREQPEALALGQFVITCCLPLLQGLLKSSMYAMECHVHQNLMVWGNDTFLWFKWMWLSSNQWYCSVAEALVKLLLSLLMHLF